MFDSSPFSQIADDNALYSKSQELNPLFNHDYDSFAINVGGIIIANGGLDTKGIPHFKTESFAFGEEGFIFF